MTDEHRRTVEDLCDTLADEARDRGDDDSPTVAALRALLAEHERLAHELVDLANFLDLDVCATVELVRRHSEAARRLAVLATEGRPAAGGGG